MRLDTEGLWRKLGVMIRLVEKSPQGTLGRTAIVKLLYLLQEVRHLPLGYNFRLYTYGPFDSNVLNDLGFAQSFQALSVKTVIYPSGYGYNVRPGPEADSMKECVAKWLGPLEGDIAWAVETFAGRSAAELELVATIVYVDRELARKAGRHSLDDLAQRVREVKPRFLAPFVLEKCREAGQLGLLSSVGQS